MCGISAAALLHDSVLKGPLHHRLVENIQHLSANADKTLKLLQVIHRFLLFYKHPLSVVQTFSLMTIRIEFNQQQKRKKIIETIV